MSDDDNDDNYNELDTLVIGHSRRNEVDTSSIDNKIMAALQHKKVKHTNKEVEDVDENERREVLKELVELREYDETDDRCWKCWEAIKMYQREYGVPLLNNMDYTTFLYAFFIEDE